MHPSVSATSETSTHQLVGYVTKMFPTFGYINNEIFFQKKCVIGPMVEVGDNVATSAVYQPNMPIKWSAEKVWRVQESRHSRTHETTEEVDTWPEKSPRRRSVEKDSIRSRERVLEGKHERHEEHHTPRKRSHSPDPRRSTSKDPRRRSVERNSAKRRRLSPESATSHSGGATYAHTLTRRLTNTSFLLNAKELLIPELRCRFPNINPPVDLYRVVCHWQSSFPLLKPLHLDNSSVFQILECSKKQSSELTPAVKPDNGYFVNVLLLSMPQTTSLHEKTVVRAESVDRTRVSLRKYIKILASGKANEPYKAIGGPWVAELDGPDPARNPQTLINTAIRTCKELLCLDLSLCTQWHRFLEFRYGRTEGSTARPTSVLFPGADLWGRKYPDQGPEALTPSKPFHKIVVYFIPDVWSLVPSADDWPEVKKSFEIQLSKELSPNFPMSAELRNQLCSEESDAPGKANLDDPKQSGSQSGSTTEAKGKQIMDQSGTEAGSSSTSDQSLADPSAKTPTASDQTQSKEDGANVTTADGTEKSVMKSHDDLNLSAMKVSELREQLKARNLPTDGIKAQLLSRLKLAIEKEAEDARKAEEERKQKEKAEQKEAEAAKEQQAKKEEAERLASKRTSKPELKADSVNVTLRNYPSILIQPKSSDLRIQTATLDELLDPKGSWLMDSQSFELVFCAHTILEMLHRDAIFILFRALVTAGDRGVQAKVPPRNSEAHGDPKTTVTKDAATRCTVDVPLLFACTILDTTSRGYFFPEEAEGLIASLGLPVSRYQLRSLVTKVADSNRIYYRALTDAEVTPSTVKSKITYSEIDDDEYLVELIRGGDAVLEEGMDSALPTGTVLVFHTNVPITSPSTADATEAHQSLPELTAPTPEEFTSHLKRMELEKIKLLKQIKNKSNDISRLRSLTDQIPNLKEQIATATSTIDDLKRRLLHARDQKHAAHRVIEQQIYNLDSTRVALRQAANRLRGRSENEATPKKSSTPTEAKDSAKTPVKASSQTPKPDLKPESKTTDSDETPLKPAKQPMETGETIPVETDLVSDNAAPSEIDESKSQKLVNGTGDMEKVDESEPMETAQILCHD